MCIRKHRDTGAGLSFSEVSEPFCSQPCCLKSQCDLFTMCFSNRRLEFYAESWWFFMPNWTMLTWIFCSNSSICSLFIINISVVVQGSSNSKSHLIPPCINLQIANITCGLADTGKHKQWYCNTAIVCGTNSFPLNPFPKFMVILLLQFSLLCVCSVYGSSRDMQGV